VFEITTNIKTFNSIREFIKSAIKPWKDKIIKSSNGRCFLTNQVNNIDVHHISKSFTNIMRETFEVTGIPFRKSTYEYTQTELDLLRVTCLALHQDVTGVTLCRRLHEDYHRLYSETTSENWKKFRLYRKKRRTA